MQTRVVGGSWRERGREGMCFFGSQRVISRGSRRFPDCSELLRSVMLLLVDRLDAVGEVGGEALRSDRPDREVCCGGLQPGPQNKAHGPPELQLSSL